MNLRIVFLAIAALTIAGATAMFARSWVASQRPVVQKVVEKKEVRHLEVLVAKKNIPAGTFVKTEHLRWQAWPEDGLMPIYVVKGKRTEKDFIDSVARAGIAAGEPITDGRVVKPGDRGFLAAVLTPGMRAISVPINARTGISGLVFPGDRVDVILSHGMRSAGKSRMTRRIGETVLKDIRVIAVDQKTDDQSGKPKVAKTATLEVTPKQAEMIVVAVELGKLALSLRSLAVDGDDPDRSDKPAVQETTAQRTRTWDREVSGLIGAMGSGGPTVTVMRGSTKSDVALQGK